MSDIYSSDEIYRVARALASVAAADTPPGAMAAALAYAFGGGPECDRLRVGNDMADHRAHNRAMMASIRASRPR
jgi:succinylarginine dihydrolase